MGFGQFFWLTWLPVLWLSPRPRFPLFYKTRCQRPHTIWNLSIVQLHNAQFLIWQKIHSKVFTCLFDMGFGQCFCLACPNGSYIGLWCQSCCCHHGHASHCFTKHTASGHTQSGIWALFHCTVHNAWFDKKFTHRYLLVCLIWGLGSVSVLHAQMARIAFDCHHAHASNCFKNTLSLHTKEMFKVKLLSQVF